MLFPRNSKAPLSDSWSAAVSIGASVNDDEPFIGDRLLEAETRQCLLLLPSSGAFHLYDDDDEHHGGKDDNDDDGVWQVHAVQAERMRARSDWFLSDPSGLVRISQSPSIIVTSIACR